MIGQIDEREGMKADTIARTFLPKFEDLVESGLFKPETPISSRTNVSGRERFEFFLINPSEPSEDMYDVVLHKISDFLPHDAAYKSVQAYLDSFELQHSPGLVIDPLPHVVKVHDRLCISRLLSDLEPTIDRSGPALQSLSFMEITENEEISEVKTRACSAGLRLPCILKDEIACGVPEAHKMWLIFNWQGLEGKLSRRGLLQNFVNHGGCLYKVYVLDSLVHISKSASIKDIPRHEVDSERSLDAVGFDNLQKIHAWQSGLATHAAADTVSLSEALVHQAVKFLQGRLKLSLFGFDIIIGEEGTHHIIDVNYFPSFKGVPNAHEALCGLLSKRAGSLPSGNCAARSDDPDSHLNSTAVNCRRTDNDSLLTGWNNCSAQDVVSWEEPAPSKQTSLSNNLCNHE